MVSRSQSRTARNEQGTSKAHHKIVSIEISGGFLDGAKLELADGLNCIIGGTGTGKTTVLELIRYTLGHMPDPGTLQAKELERLLEANLGEGKVRVSVRTKYGVSYVAERAWDEPCQVLDEKGDPSAISLDRDLVFGVDVYSLHEIGAIAATPSLQLAVLDRFVDPDARRVANEIRRTVRDLEENGAALVRLEADTDTLQEAAEQLPALTEKLRALQEAGSPDAAKINQADSEKAVREKERKAVGLLVADVPAVVSQTEQTVSSSIRRLQARLDPEVVDGPNRKAWKKVTGPLRDLLSTLEDLSNETRRKADFVRSALTDLGPALEAVHAEQEHDYRELVARSQEVRERATERGQLHKQHADATAAKKELEERQKDRKLALERRERLLASLEKLRDERFSLRRRVAEQLTEKVQPNVRVSVLQSGNRDDYRAVLNDLLKGSRMRGVPGVIDKLVDAATPGELANLVASGDAVRLAEQTHLDDDRAKKIVALLGAREAINRIELVELDDAPKIELMHGATYKESAQLSAGQRCTAVLALLIVESERPLLIDQPEDNLDNEYLFESIVRLMRGVKLGRQLVFVTHNANIPVGGEAERVFELSSDGQRSRIVRAGTVEELKDRIEKVMDGGEKAFLLRKERYGH